MEYLPRAWRDYLTPSPDYTVPVVPSHTFGRISGSKLPDAGPVAGSDYALLRSRLLDAQGIDRAILTYDTGALIAVHPAQFMGRELVRAANDWCIDRWLDGRDQRLYSLVLVPNQLPEESAAEIRRAGAHPRMVGVLLGANGTGLLAGHSHFYPIYEAAVEMGLPIVLEAGNESNIYTLTHHTAGGPPVTYAEYRILADQSLTGHLGSLIAQGVFERYPGLKVLAMGAGAEWLGAVMTRFDFKFDSHGREVPWAPKRPSEYFHRSIRLTTYPLDPDDGAEELVKLLKTVDRVEDMLVYASGYPNWDTDWVADARRVLPVEWHDKVFNDNAAGFFAWPSAEAAAEALRPSLGREAAGSTGRD
ncbi:amidohydrolase family protein [Candidatus Nephthysia bennettiae]|uniref:Amidohydrolase family protein n=1 Tax=Candidatus Nephthysia bennettiae TaxID=3127016 RepID=A0A934K0U9_9BACT|nr:amidohydrolase family protein [Candidatus Dormibacteraeota bacterium]MBJ7614049.1 amidohydrolase family protein [Candidatus Dormibacteraeota bacterium]